jgi:hypothetical protein
MSNKRHFKIKSWHISYLALQYPIMFTIISLLYLLFLGKNNVAFIIVANIFFYLPFLFQIKHQKLTLTNRKIYYYCFFRKKADITWDLYKHLRLVSYKQTMLGKIFDYGSITFVNRDEQALTINMVQNIQSLYQQTIYYSTKYMLEMNPETEQTLSDEVKEIIDIVENNKLPIDSLSDGDNLDEYNQEDNESNEANEHNNEENVQNKTKKKKSSSKNKVDETKNENLDTDIIVDKIDTLD